MNEAQLVQQLNLSIEDVDCLIEVFSRDNGIFFAQTAFGPGDVIINDGFSIDEVLQRHQALLPLAIRSRRLWNALN